jgi:polyisoprenoid-binding protein YceI
MKKPIFLVLILTGLAFTGNRNKDKRKIAADTSLSQLSYAMRHPLHNFTASSKELKAIAVVDDETKLEMIAVSVPVKSFDSGNSNRDSHTIEVTQALKYPNVTFSADNIIYSGNRVSATGKLVFHGITNSITIQGIQKHDNNKLVLSGNFEIDMTDYGIKPPAIMGMSTDKMIKLAFSLTFPV